MQIPLVNSVASWFLKKRFHQIDLFLKYPYDVQNELLVNLLEVAKNTELGLKYDFKSIESYLDPFLMRILNPDYVNETLTCPFFTLDHFSNSHFLGFV